MSLPWRLTKKLRETHLGQFASFTRPSIAIPTKSTSAGSKAAPLVSGSNSDNADDADDADASPPSESLTQSSVTKVLEPGVLIVTIHEARGLAVPDKYKNILSIQDRTTPENSSTSRICSKAMPYALVNFENSEFLVNSVAGTPQNPLWPGPNTQYKFDVSRVSDLTIHLFFRNPSPTTGSGRTQDIFLGDVQLTPDFGATQSPKTNTGGKHSPAVHGLNGLAWFNIQNGTGQLQVGIQYVESQTQKLSVNDFELLKVIGRGSFGKVMQVRKKDTNCVYALKTIQKAKIVSRSEVTHTLAERSVLAKINNPFIVPLKFSFQSPEKLYFVLAFVNGGELFDHLNKERRFDVNRSRFYTSELLCALECLHGFNVVYRDLKPENILLDSQGHIALCDFGLCKLKLKDEDYTNTFCGTPEYLAPELVLGKGYNKTVDWWTLGILLYEMLTGLPPFYDQETNEMYRKILSLPLTFPAGHVVPPAAKDLLTKLLNRNPDERLGAKGSAEIKAHPFFDGIDWRKLLERKYAPAFKPDVDSPTATGNIPDIWTQETPKDSPVDDPSLSQTIQRQFDGFSYVRPVPGLSDGGGSIVDSSFLRSADGRQ